MKKTFSIMACMLLLPCWGYAAQHDEEINHKNNYREYLNAAVAAANNMDIVLARDLYKQSVAQIAKDDKQALLDIDAEMAAVYIRNGANDVAADILQVHIDDNSATARMKADYLLALRNLGYVKRWRPPLNVCILLRTRCLCMVCRIWLICCFVSKNISRLWTFMKVYWLRIPAKAMLA